MLKHPRIAIVGSSGQLARSLLDAAHRREITAIARGRPQADLQDGDSLAALIDAIEPDIVVNAGGMTAVDAAESDRETAFALNSQGARNIAIACASAGVPLVHVSTDYVFNGSATCPLTEDTAVAPLNVYGASKAAGEDAVRECQPHHLILRTAWVHSEHAHNFLKTMLRLCETRREVRVVADQHGSPTYAGHLADAILDLTERLIQSPSDQAAWGTYHVSGAGATTWHGFAAEIFRHAPLLGFVPPALHAISTSEYPLPARRPTYSVLDNSRLKQTFGIALPSWQDGVSACIWRIAAERAGVAVETTAPVRRQVAGASS
ncbi:MAG: dTDP-4-dehydrorhamnose reductase [Hyphomicrobiaceae bacterium]